MTDETTNAEGRAIGLGHPADEAMQLISSRRKAADAYAWHIQRQIRRFEAQWSNRGR